MYTHSSYFDLVIQYSILFREILLLKVWYKYGLDKYSLIRCVEGNVYVVLMPK